MRYRITKKFLVFWCLFIGIGALWGSLCMLIDPSGKLLQMDKMLPYFEVLPFSGVLFKNYIFSGIALLIVNGITNLTAAYLLIKNKKIGIILGMIFGFTLMLWITIQFVIFPTNILSISYFIFGIIQLLTGYMTYVFYMQDNFKFNLEEYKNIGINADILVVYFSRMGYTKMVAYQEANKLGADILEIKAKEKTSGTLGFWWCGRYGMHKWRMEIKNVDSNLSKYDKIVIVSPIWVFNVSSPIRDFCYRYAGKINKVQYIFTHFMKANFKNARSELDGILNKKSSKFTSICVRMGKVKNIKIFED